MSDLKELSKKSNIEFIEPIFDIDKLNTIYAKASIFVYPSVAEKGETFGVSPLEAMSWGCATIVSDLECFKDFLIHNKNGLCFDHRSEKKVAILSNYLNDLINKVEIRESIAKQGLSVNETHSNEVLSKVFLAEFQSMIKK